MSSPESSLAEAASASECRRALLARYLPASIEIEPGPPMSTREWVVLAASHLNASQACAVVEHVFGVLPLMSRFDGAHGWIASLASGTTLGALGLFTPNRECAWAAAPLKGEWLAGTLRVRGEVRLPYPEVEGAIVPVRVTEAEQRLAWLDLRTDGVDRRDSRSGGRAARDASPCWLLIDGAAIEPAALSRPTTRAPGGELDRQLHSYAGVWALSAVHIARRIVLALRRAVRTTRCHDGSDAVGDSQLVAMSLAEVEIETELVAAAIDRAISPVAPATGLMLALSAARVLSVAAGTARQVRDQLGLPLDGWLADASEPALNMYLGGTPMLERELACALDIGRSAAGDLR